MGVTPSGTVETNRGVRARVRAAGRALEENDKTHTRFLHYMKMLQDASVRLKVMLILTSHIENISRAVFLLPK